MSEISRRADSMMATPMKDLPSSCVEYIKYLSLKYGYCGEVALTAMYHYLQAEHGLTCSDDLYEIDVAGLNWFKQHRRDNSVLSSTRSM